MTRLASTFLEFAQEEARRAPLYSAMASVIARHDHLLEFFADTPEPQRRPVLYFAALHRQVLLHPASPLARCYPTVTRRAARPQEAAQLVVEASEAWADSLRDDLATRTTQTNEIGRAAAVVVGLSHSVPHDGRSIALLELGASAGLLLACDRYRIRFDRRVVHGPAESPVTIEVAGRGERPPDRPHPPIAWRRGVDLTPLDVADPAQRGWLEACCWADDLERFDRLRAALDLATPDPPVVESGDALAELPRLLRAAPEGHHLVVMNAWALTYLTPARREAVGKIIAGAGRDRDLTWLSIESPAQTPELPRPPDPLRRPGATDLIAVSARAGQIEVARLAELHPHGRWIDWMARRHPAGPDQRSGNDDDLDPTIQRSPFGGGIAGYR